MYGALALPLMEDQFRFSIRMMKTVWTSCIEASERALVRTNPASPASIAASEMYLLINVYPRPITDL